jgi:Mrp family chromosome partitioning ATPase
MTDHEMGGGGLAMGGPLDHDRCRELCLSILGCLDKQESAWIVVTSAQTGEGVTELSLGLAEMMAEIGPTVLVEANWRHPSSRLADVAGAVSLQEAMRSPGILLPVPAAASPSVTVIGAGHGGQPRDGQGLAKLVPRLKERYAYGIIDTPPVLSSPDALMLGGCVDGCVLVVEAGRTQWQAVARARDLVRGVGLEPLGIVLNKRQYPIPSWLYKRLS